MDLCYSAHRHSFVWSFIIIFWYIVFKVKTSLSTHSYFICQISFLLCEKDKNWNETQFSWADCTQGMCNIRVFIHGRWNFIAWKKFQLSTRRWSVIFPQPCVFTNWISSRFTMESIKKAIWDKAGDNRVLLSDSFIYSFDPLFPLFVSLARLVNILWRNKYLMSFNIAKNPQERPLQENKNWCCFKWLYFRKWRRNNVVYKMLKIRVFLQLSKDDTYSCRLISNALLNFLLRACFLISFFSNRPMWHFYFSVWVIVLG